MKTKIMIPQVLKWVTPSIFFLGLLALPAGAQTNKATLVGTVSDTSGGVIPGATVVATRVETGIERSTTTGEDGTYTFPLLDIGGYRVTASAQGFQTVTRENISLRIGDRLPVDIELTAAGGEETVTITAEAPIVKTEASDRGEVISGREVTELPLSGRNYTQLATLVPGVSRAFVGVLTDAQAFNNGDPRAGSPPGGSNPAGSTEAARFARSGGASLSVNGQRPTNNNFSLDGVDNNEPQFGTIGVYPNPDSIAEFRVTTSVPPAEIGRAGGAVINTIYRSGTNDLHGSLYYYGQNSALNAFHPSLKRQRGEAIAAGSLNPPDKAVQQIHEFGGTIGGPIITNRTFFFGDYLGQRNNIPHPFATAVPTIGAREGDFSAFTGQIFDPRTGQPFAGNRVPAARFGTAGHNFLNAYPLPNVNVTNPSDFNPNFFSTRNNREIIDSFTVKVDHRLTDNNSLMGRFSYSDQKRVRASFFETVPAGFGNGDEFGDTRQLAISDVHTFNPSVLNEFRFGVTKINISILNAGIGGTQGISETFSEDLGIPNSNLGTFETSGSILTGGFGNGFLEFAGDGGPFIVESTNPYFADTVTVIKGSHALKLGGELRLRRLNTIDGGRSGGLKGNLAYGDNGPATGPNPNCPAASQAPDGQCFVDSNGVPFGGAGNAIANILLGVPALQAFRGSNPGGPFNLRSQEWGFFVQDDWKVNDRLTLNLGLRYDLFTPFTERDGRLGNFDLDARQVVVASDNGDTLIQTDKNNFGPRLGFAYSFGPDRSMVLRGGYGLLYTVDGVDYPPLIRNPPFTNQVAFDPFNSLTLGRSVFSLETGPPDVPAVDPTNIPLNVVVFVQDPEQKIASVQQFNLTYQYQFSRDWAIDIGYVGNRSKNLLATRNIGSGGTAQALNRAGVFLLEAVAYENRASSQYDSLQVQLRKRVSHNVQGQVSYTWGHAIDESTGVFQGIGDERGNRGGPIDPFDFGADRGNSSLDVRHLLSASVIVDLPFGRGQRFLNQNGVVDKIFGGFQLNAIVTARSGFPFSVRAEDGIVRPSIIGDPFANVPPGRFMNPLAFATNRRSPEFLSSVTNAAGNTIRFGNLGRNTFRGPSYYNTDLSVFKNTSITETARFQFGFEFFNFFNHTNFIVPNNNADDPGSFGRFDTAFPGRITQYRLKLIF